MENANILLHSEFIFHSGMKLIFSIYFAALIFWLLFDQAKSNKHLSELFYCSGAEINFSNSFSACPP